MALSKIIERINQQAEQQAHEALAVAERKVEEVLKEGQARAGAILKDSHDRASDAAGVLKKRLITVASTNLRNQIGEARQKAIDSAFDQALGQLQQMGDKETLELLKELVVDAAETGEEQIIVSPRDRARVTKAFLAEVNTLVAARGLKANLTLADATRPMSGGLVLLGENVEINCSFDTTLKLMRDEMEPAVASLLFGSGDGK